MTAAEWADHVGRHVRFTYFHGETDDGIVTSVNEKYVFVRFGTKVSSEACDPGQLELLR